MLPLWLTELDYQAFHFFNGFAGQSVALDAVFVLLAEYVIYFMVAGYIFFRTLIPQGILAVVVGRLFFVTLIRSWFFRPRPFVIAAVTQLVPHDPLEGSFPSAHATIMFALAFTLFPKHPGWGAFYLFLALISSLSRVVIGVHFPLDVFVGMIIGAAAAWIGKKIMSRRAVSSPQTRAAKFR